MGTALEDALRAVEAQGPREGLQTVAALRARIEALEEALVAKAVGEGWSWRQVAELLGVSKQAVHKKHARRLADRPAPPASADRRKLVVTGRARLSVRFAREEVAELGARNLRPEHLLLGLLRDEASVAGEALRGAGVTLEDVRPAARALVAAGEASPEGALPVSPEARAVMESSLREAVRRGDGHLGAEHLLLALVHQEDGTARALLAALGADEASLEDALGRALGAPV